MFDQLRKNSFKHSLLLSVILLITGITLSVFHAENAYYSIVGYVDFATLSPDEIKSQLVDIELRENYGSFMESGTTNSSTHRTTITDYYYIIYTGAWDNTNTPYKYMAIKVPAEYEDQMDQMTINSYNGQITAPIYFYGKIKKLGSKETEYFNAFLKNKGFTSQQIQEMTIPYYIEVARGAKPAHRVFYIILFFGGLSMILWAVLRTVKASKGGYLNKIREDIASIGCTEYTAESDFNTAISIEGNKSAKMGQLFIYHDIRSTVPRAIPISKIAWAYQTTTTTRNKYGRTIGTTYSVTIFKTDDKYANARNAPGITVANEATALKILNRLADNCPWIILGHSDELKRMFINDRARFLNLKYNTVEHTISASAEHTAATSAETIDPEC